MEPDEAINRYKTILKRHFTDQGLEVHVDIPISDDIRWRPHLFVKNSQQIILDIVDTELIHGLQLRKYAEVMNAFPNMRIYVVMIGEMHYAPDFVAKCAEYKLGIFVVGNGQPKEILPFGVRDIEGLVQTDQIAIIPDTPFGNVLSLRKCLRKCREHVYWFENNLPRDSLEVLYDSIAKGDLNVKSVKLLRGLDDKITSFYRDDFKHFQNEMVSHDIDSEMRVILDRRIMRQIHGRYLYSIDEKGRELLIQLPPLNSLKGNQWDSIFTKVKTVPPFDAFWEKGKDMLKDWSEIDQAVKEHLKHKMEEKD
jgi:hypothetical protein